MSLALETALTQRHAANAPPRAAGAVMVEAHWAVLDLGAAEVARLASMLAPDEQRRAAKFRRLVDRGRYVVRRARLRQLLAARLGCAPHKVPLSYNEFGKPYVAETDWRFNLSHSRGLALYTTARGVKLGCDIEWQRPRLATKAAAECFFSDNEVRALMSVADGAWVEAFFNAWTRKEAVIKALGLGVSCSLKSFDVALKPAEPAAILRGPSGWSLYAFQPTKGLHVAIAADTACCEIALPPVPRC